MIAKYQQSWKNSILRHPLTNRKGWCNHAFVVRALINDMVCTKSRNAFYFYLEHLPKNMTVGAAYFKTERQNENAENVMQHYDININIYNISHQFERYQGDVNGQ